MLGGSAWASRGDRAFASVEYPQQRPLAEWERKRARRRAELEEKTARRQAEFTALLPAIAAQVAADVSAAVAAALRTTRVGHHEGLNHGKTTTSAPTTSVADDHDLNRAPATTPTTAYSSTTGPAPHADIQLARKVDLQPEAFTSAIGAPSSATAHEADLAPTRVAATSATAYAELESDLTTATSITCSTKCPSRDVNELTPASTPGAAPTSPTATTDIIPVRTAAVAGDGTLDGKTIKGAPSTADKSMETTGAIRNDAEEVPGYVLPDEMPQRDEIQQQPWPPPLVFCENSLRDELQEIFGNVASVDLHHCGSNCPRGTTLTTPESQVLQLPGTFSSSVSCRMAKDQCSAKTKCSFNALLLRVQKWAPDIQCVQPAQENLPTPPLEPTLALELSLIGSSKCSAVETAVSANSMTSLMWHDIQDSSLSSVESDFASLDAKLDEWPTSVERKPWPPPPNMHGFVQAQQKIKEQNMSPPLPHFVSAIGANCSYHAPTYPAIGANSVMGLTVGDDTSYVHSRELITGFYHEKLWDPGGKFTRSSWSNMWREIQSTHELCFCILWSLAAVLLFFFLGSEVIRVFKERQPPCRAMQAVVHTCNLRENQLGGVIFGCKHETNEECFSKQLFDLPALHYSYVRNVKASLPLLLVNYTERKLHGVFEAASSGENCIDPYAGVYLGKWNVESVQLQPWPSWNLSLSVLTWLECFCETPIFSSWTYRMVLKSDGYWWLILWKITEYNIILLQLHDGLHTLILFNESKLGCKRDQSTVITFASMLYTLAHAVDWQHQFSSDNLLRAAPANLEMETYLNSRGRPVTDAHGCHPQALAEKRFPSCEILVFGTPGTCLLHLKIEWPLYFMYSTSGNKSGKLFHPTKARKALYPILFLAYVAIWIFRCWEFCPEKWLWDPGIWVLLCFFGIVSQAEATGRRNAAALAYYRDICLDNIYYFDKVCADQDYYMDVFSAQVLIGHDYHLGVFLEQVRVICYLNIVKVCVDYGTRRDLVEFMKLQVPWDPGGSTRHRLGVKPKFKEGGMLATLLPADGPPLLGRGRSETRQGGGRYIRAEHLRTDSARNGTASASPLLVSPLSLSRVRVPLLLSCVMA